MAERWRVILKWVLGSETLAECCFDATIANDRDEDGLNMLFDVRRKSDAIVLANVLQSS
jgi:hypothetical protein